MQAKSKKNYTGPVVLVVMDGVGIRQEIECNAVALAYTEFLHQLEQNYPKLALQASGEAVGILAGQMGNSEVGHNALGSGQIIKQGIAKINQAFATGEIWQSSAWQGAIENLKTHQSTLHFSGIFSDGGVHSELFHLFAMLRRAAESGIKTMRVHAVSLLSQLKNISTGLIKLSQKLKKSLTSIFRLPLVVAAWSSLLTVIKLIGQSWNVAGKP